MSVALPRLDGATFILMEQTRAGDSLVFHLLYELQETAVVKSAVRLSVSSVISVVASPLIIN